MIPECIGRTHPKGAITKRNRWMVEAATFLSATLRGKMAALIPQ